MSTYILKVWTVETNVTDIFNPYTTQHYRNEETAGRMIDFYKYDQGDKTAILYENYLELPMVDGTALAPSNLF